MDILKIGKTVSKLPKLSILYFYTNCIWWISFDLSLPLPHFCWLKRGNFWNLPPPLRIYAPSDPPSKGPPDTNYLLFLSFSGTPKHCMQGRKGRKCPFEIGLQQETSIVGHKVKDSPSLISLYWPWKVLKKLRFSCTECIFLKKKSAGKRLNWQILNLGAARYYCVRWKRWETGRGRRHPVLQPKMSERSPVRASSIHPSLFSQG